MLHGAFWVFQANNNPVLQRHTANGYLFVIFLVCPHRNLSFVYLTQDTLKVKIDIFISWSRKIALDAAFIPIFVKVVLT